MELINEIERLTETKVRVLRKHRDGTDDVMFVNVDLDVAMIRGQIYKGSLYITHSFPESIQALKQSGSFDLVGVDNEIVASIKSHYKHTQ